MRNPKVLLASGAIVLVGGLATALLSSSCDTVCTTEARASVVVHLVDENGDPIGADWVSFLVSEQPPRAISTPGQAAECIDEDCTQWVAGYETEGLFTVTAQVCGRQVSGRTEVELTEDGCHVDTRHLYLEADTLQCERPRSVDMSDQTVSFPPPPREPLPFTAPEPTLCTREARASVIGRVVVQEGTSRHPVTPDGAFYQVDGGPLLSAMCLDDECLSWAAGWEQPGEIELYAIRGRHLLRGRASVGLTEDGCHVATEFVDLVDPAEPADVEIVDHGPVLTSKPRPCTYEARPSVIVEIVDGDGEMANPVGAKSLWWEIEEIAATTRGMCREFPCTTWFAGIEQTGVFRIHADVCDRIFETEVAVEHQGDGCHVQTEHVRLVVDQDGCPR